MILKAPTVRLVPELPARPTIAEEVLPHDDERCIDAPGNVICKYQCEFALSLESLSLDCHGTRPPTIAFLSRTQAEEHDERGRSGNEEIESWSICIDRGRHGSCSRFRGIVAELGRLAGHQGFAECDREW
jgi:hypothetical protein